MYRVAFSLASGKWAAISMQPRENDTYGPAGRLEPVEIFQGGDGYGKWGVDGRYYAKYGLGWSLLAVPFCLAGKALAILVNVPDGFATRSLVMMINPILTAAGCVVLYFLARRIYTSSISLSISLIYGVCTITWYYSKSAFSEPLVVLLILSAILAIERDQFIWAGALLGYALLTRQTIILVVIPVVTWALNNCFRKRGKNILVNFVFLIIPIASGQVTNWIYNYLRFGNPLDFGYLTVGWDTPLFLGLYGLLISPGKGLFVYSPILLLSIFGFPYFARKDWLWLFVSIYATYVLPHALYSDWSGGGGWGGRLLLPIIPLLILTAGTTLERWRLHHLGRVVIIVLFVLSTLIQLLGVSVNWVRHLQQTYDKAVTPAEYYQRVYFSWQDSPIPGQYNSLREVSGIMQDSHARMKLIQIVENITSTELADSMSIGIQLLSFNVPDFWFVYWSFFDVHWLITLTMIAILLCAMSYAGGTLYRINKT